MRVKCNACGGEYDTVQPDGLTYYHVCPPIACVRATRADGSTALVNVAKLAADDVIRVRRGAAIVDSPVADLQPDDQRVDEVLVDRPNKRDERIVPVDEKTSAPIAVGAGVTRVDPLPPYKGEPVIL